MSAPNASPNSLTSKRQDLMPGGAKTNATPGASCAACGSPGRLDQQFCARCGHKLADPATPAEKPGGKGRTATPASQVVGTRGRRRSKAWIYYTFLSGGSFIMLCGGHLAGLAGMALFGLYARYLYRGGRFVLWIW